MCVADDLYDIARPVPAPDVEINPAIAGAWAPFGEQQSEVTTVDQTVLIKIKSGIRAVPGTQQETEVIPIDHAGSIEISGAVRRGGAGQRQRKKGGQAAKAVKSKAGSFLVALKHRRFLIFGTRKDRVRLVPGSTGLGKVRWVVRSWRL